jgi:Protein of unknown function (DUF1579)
MLAEAQDEHRWLQQLVGEWSYQAEAIGPGQELMKAEGTEAVRALGDFWVLAEGEGTMPDGTPAKSLMTLGYDPTRKRYVGTWIGSMMTNLWVYDGALDAGRRMLTLSADGPSMSGGGGMAKYQDIITVESADHRILTARVLGEDGAWTEFMTAHYRRKR